MGQKEYITFYLDSKMVIEWQVKFYNMIHLVPFSNFVSLTSTYNTTHKGECMFFHVKLTQSQGQSNVTTLSLPLPCDTRLYTIISMTKLPQPTTLACSQSMYFLVHFTLS